MKKGPFKLKGMDFGNSPIQQGPPKNLNIIGSKGIPSGENFEKYGEGYKSIKQKFEKFKLEASKTPTVSSSDQSRIKGKTKFNPKTKTYTKVNVTKQIKGTDPVSKSLSKAVKGKGVSGVPSSKAPSNIRPFGPGTRPLSQGVVKGLKNIAKRFLGPVGVGLTAYEIGKTIPKVVKSTIKDLKKRAKSGNVNIGRKL